MSFISPAGLVQSSSGISVMNVTMAGENAFT